MYGVFNQNLFPTLMKHQINEKQIKNSHHTVEYPKIRTTLQMLEFQFSKPSKRHSPKSWRLTKLKIHTIKNFLRILCAIIFALYFSFVCIYLYSLFVILSHFFSGSRTMKIELFCHHHFFFFSLPYEYLSILHLSQHIQVYIVIFFSLPLVFYIPFSRSHAFYYYYFFLLFSISKYKRRAFCIERHKSDSSFSHMDLWDFVVKGNIK